MHPSVERVAAALRAAGAAGEVRVLSESARTARDAASALGCDVGAIASSLVFRAGDELLLVVTSGRHRVDEARVASLVGVPALARATPEEVRAATGFVIGGVAPLGHTSPLRALVDNALAAYDVVWASAGHSHAVFPTSYDELLQLTGGAPADVGD